ncbi:DUF2891 domain-containing protein [Ulvibacter antarcticus]|uniref:DUF2891 family protein n=1 Tax=Ulvibacter antarcticus TaxID=442714 RepID=A0A3L9YEP0_9FLAO|nr:DUF2891 domain-containing protein [Ulvibacter antarcticus]RMA58854.1 Protein of unknown function (DUF2891) [Ulvibacter antarcticus]
MKKVFFFFITILAMTACKDTSKNEISSEVEKKAIKIFAEPQFTIAEANKLLELPLHCVGVEYPNKLGQVIGDASDLQAPSNLHPIFYGCFDWHSAVHGYWSMVSLLKDFPEMEKASEAKAILKQHITKENVAIELVYFQKKINKGYERTYGWAWLLKLAETIHLWDDPLARELELILKPLTDEIVAKYIEFLPKLNYPIRVGEHTNTAFGLTFAYDFAKTTKEVALKELIVKRARDFYLADAGCPIDWEPSGYDFLSPCLEEIDIMRRVLNEPEFENWITAFLPQLEAKTYHLKVGEVSDRTDGKLVHLDGLNFSRAWVFYGLARQYPQYEHLKNLANEHIEYSYSNLVGDSYEGGHWLGSFAIYALNNK